MQQQQKQQEPHMGFNGGGDSNRGLTRFWSAPTTWLDTLVQDLEDNPPSQNHCLPPQQHQQQQIPTLRNSNSTFYDATISSGAGPISGASSDLGLFRQNSSPAELLDHLTSSQVLGSDGFLPASFGVSGNFDYNLEFPTTKRSLDSEFQQEQPKFPSQVKGEQSGVSSSFSDMEMEKLFEDSVPCRVRAKRGCATHPRSIAERVRRTRISDRIRKLQDLVPNMDKQTNTADMLEEAVEYVKLLQKQIKELSEHQQNCKCVARS